MNLGEYLKSAKESLFRFEYLQEFDVPEEHEFFRTYQANGQVEIGHLMKDWWNFLEIKHKDGVITERVRLVRFPPSKYLEWELYIHRQSIEHGDDIRILDEKHLRQELKDLGDFWLIDNTVELKMNYDPDGKYLGFEKTESQPCIKAKEYLLINSTPL